MTNCIKRAKNSENQGLYIYTHIEEIPSFVDRFLISEDSGSPSPVRNSLVKRYTNYKNSDQEDTEWFLLFPSKP
jgi:hypothetical protein